MANPTIYDFARDGTTLLSGALLPCLSELYVALKGLADDGAGLRLHGVEGLSAVLGTNGCIGTVAKRFLGLSAKPVRAILFNKTASTNWSLGWHQDRTICVKQRREVIGFGPWTIKQGMHHAEPPFDLLGRMVTVRCHLDPVADTNAPLMIAPGSHKLGRIPVAQVAGVVERCGTTSCLADVGDIWVYSTPILHASDAATVPTNRRVLQVDYSADELPGGLKWLGV